MNEIIVAIIIGIAGALLGAFYRNCLKAPNMIFNFWYRILDRWVEKSRLPDSTFASKVVAFIAYPLGYCIYCSTTWVAELLYFFTAEEFTLLGFVIVLGVQHLVTVMYCKFLISGNEDLNEEVDFVEMENEITAFEKYLDDHPCREVDIEHKVVMTGDYDELMHSLHSAKMGPLTNKNLCKKYPNDMKLGEIIRSYYGGDV